MPYLIFKFLKLEEFGSNACMPSSALDGFTGPDKPGTMAKWWEWSNRVTADDSIEDALIPTDLPQKYPTPTPIPPYDTLTSDGKYQQSVDEFTQRFAQITQKPGSPLYFPELTLGPFVYKDVLGRPNITYYVDGGRDNMMQAYGNYATLINVLGAISQLKFPDINLDYTYTFDLPAQFDELVKSPLPQDGSMFTTHVYDKKTFINFLDNRCARDFYYSSINSPGTDQVSVNLRCPTLTDVEKNLIKLGMVYDQRRNGAFILHFVPVDKISFLNKPFDGADKLATLVIQVGKGDVTRRGE